MQIQHIQIKIEDEGQRIDHFLHVTYFSDKSRSYVQNALKKGDIKVNGSVVKTGYALKTNDVIEIDIKAEEKLDLEPVNLNLDIVYEDEDLMVINKPQGMVVHPASSYHEPTLVHGLLHQADQLSAINGTIRPGIVHRIDKDTSGLLVVAKHDSSHRLLSEALASHDIKRTYVCLVYGSFVENEGKIDAPIGRHPKNRLKNAVVANGKHAVTHFKVLKRFTQYTLLECELETGRTHQIRVHLSYINHPIVGDPLYGPKQVIGDQGQFLHAKALSFMHPIKKEQMTFTADLPKNFIDFIENLL